MIVLDTDHLSVLQHHESIHAKDLRHRLEAMEEEEVVTTVITYEEQVRSWLSLIGQNSDVHKQIPFPSAPWQIEVTAMSPVRPLPDGNPITRAMNEYRFRLIISGPLAGQDTDEALLDATDALGDAGCDDCSISTHGQGLELEFDRAHQSLQEAIASAIQDVEGAGFVIESIQLDRDAVFPVGTQ